MDIRFAVKDDLYQLLGLYKELNPEDQPVSLSLVEKIWIKSLSSDYIKYVVAVVDDNIVASCNVAIILNLTRSCRPYGIIENVITNEKYRRKGIGCAVIDYAVKYAKQSNCYKVILLSSSKRTEAHKFYESIGFNGSSKKGFEIRFDKW